MNATTKFRIFLPILSLALISGGRADSISTTWTDNVVIPDNVATGIAFAFSINSPAPEQITGVTVDLNISGGWDGDLYAYLSHGPAFCVLLNRIGRTATNPSGSSASGMIVEFADNYLTDIHNATGTGLNGNFQPDGRSVNPFAATDTDPRTAMLASFINLDANGPWTLFFADLSPIATSTLHSWTVNINTAIVPEPGCVALMSAAFLIAAVFRYRRNTTAKI